MLVLGPPNSRVMYSIVLSVIPSLVGVTGDNTGDCLVVGPATSGAKFVDVGVWVGVGLKLLGVTLVTV